MKKEKKTILISLSKHFKIVIILFSICTIIISLYSTLRYFKFQNAYIEKSLDYYSNQLVKSVTEAYTSYENISYNIASVKMFMITLQAQPREIVSFLCIFYMFIEKEL